MNKLVTTLMALAIASTTALPVVENFTCKVDINKWNTQLLQVNYRLPNASRTAHGMQPNNIVFDNIKLAEKNIPASNSQIRDNINTYLKCLKARNLHSSVIKACETEIYQVIQEKTGRDVRLSTQLYGYAQTCAALAALAAVSYGLYQQRETLAQWGKTAAGYLEFLFSNPRRPYIDLTNARIANAHIENCTVKM
ncbi:MAG: hypothetical protein WCE21_03295 [Candidatus Babeliales bacterium]